MDGTSSFKMKLSPPEVLQARGVIARGLGGSSRGECGRDARRVSRAIVASTMLMPIVVVACVRVRSLVGSSQAQCPLTGSIKLASIASNGGNMFSLLP
eukprot:9131101-Pyramimonas_sp.AAC.1